MNYDLIWLNSANISSQFTCFLFSENNVKHHLPTHPWLCKLQNKVDATCPSNPHQTIKPIKQFVPWFLGRGDSPVLYVLFDIWLKIMCIVWTKTPATKYKCKHKQLRCSKLLPLPLKDRDVPPTSLCHKAVGTNLACSDYLL